MNLFSRRTVISVSLALFAVFAGLIVFDLNAPAEEQKIRVANFPNITHAQALVGRANGWFDKKLAGKATIEWTSFNAGPSVIEALFAGQIDIAYIGPSPAVNGFVKSEGDALKIVAGSASGGAALVVRNDLDVKSPDDFHHKKMASPQLGNTQDVSLRSWLSRNGLKTKEVGGDVQVLPLANPDQLTLFLKKDLDAAWTVEPWVSILIHKGEGRVFLEESTLWPEGKYATTVLIARRKFLEERPDLVRDFVRAHVEITQWINDHKEEAKVLVNGEIEKETRKPLDFKIIDDAFNRIQFTSDPIEGSVHLQAQNAFRAGFLKKEPVLDGLFELRWLKDESLETAAKK